MNPICPVVPSNPLLAALPAEAAAALGALLELVSLSAGQMLHEAGEPLRQVYFPLTATISLVSPLQNGAAVEVAVVGREGVVGVSALLGGSVAPCRAVVQRAGLAYRLSVRELPTLLRAGGGAAAAVAALHPGSVGAHGTNLGLQPSPRA